MNLIIKKYESNIIHNKTHLKMAKPSAMIGKEVMYAFENTFAIRILETLNPFTSNFEYFAGLLKEHSKTEYIYVNDYGRFKDPSGFISLKSRNQLKKLLNYINKKKRYSPAPHVIVNEQAVIINKGDLSV